MDTIYALSSGGGKAGVAIIRLSGPRTSAAIQAMCRRLPPARRAVLTHIRHPETGDMIDQGLVLWFPAPASFTGEDAGELHIHGGRAVIAATLAALAGMAGMRAAEAGEFTRRAFANGRLDLTAIEGLSDLLDADTQLQRRAALRVAMGANRTLYDGWRQEIVTAQALVEATIDFSDEGDVPRETRQAVLVVVERLYAAITTHLASFTRAQKLRDGVQIVIAGPPNAGKSSLLNWFAQKDVAIVTAEPGTTRDVIEVHLDLKGVPFTLCDTAGLRASGHRIEIEGMRRTRTRMADADLVLWLSENGESPPEIAVPLWHIRSKQDLHGADDDGCMHVSTLTGFGLDALVARLYRFGDDLLASADDAPLMIRERHRLSFVVAQRHVSAVLAGGEGMALEVLAEELRLAALAIGRVTGVVDVEDVLGEIFARFCIGK